MRHIAITVLLLAHGANSLRMGLESSGKGDSAPAMKVKTAAVATVKGKRHRDGTPPPARSPNGRSYIYIAGVPGTGQEFWRGVLRRCTDAQICQPRAFPFYTGLLFGNAEKVNKSWTQFDRQHTDRIVPMNLVSPDLSRQPDMAFYRAYSSKVSGFEDPRLPLYYKIATSVGDGLKVVVLTRNNEKELLAWNMKQFKLSERDADVKLAADIRTLANQLKELPADSYRCIGFEELRAVRGQNLKTLARLSELRSEAFSLKLHHMLTRGMYGCGFMGVGLEMAFECPHLHITAPKTRAALDTLEDLCDPMDFAVQSKQGVNFERKVQWLME